MRQFVGQFALLVMFKFFDHTEVTVKRAVCFQEVRNYVNFKIE